MPPEPSLTWYLVLWYPLWLLGGVLFLIAAWQANKSDGTAGCRRRSAGMGEFPPDLVADLRGLQRRPELQRPELHGSLWREPYLVEHTYGAPYRFVRDQVNPPGEVWDLGCGTGYMVLELARDGCAVVAIDSDEASIDLSRDTYEANQRMSNRGSVTYELADVAEWEAPPDSFDIVLASRVLHQRSATSIR